MTDTALTLAREDRLFLILMANCGESEQKERANAALLNECKIIEAYTKNRLKDLSVSRHRSRADTPEQDES